MAWIGLIVGFTLGIICMAIVANGKRGDDHGIDACQECKRQMCAECEKWQAARADREALDEKCATLQRSIAQIRGENCRLYGRLYYQQRVGVAR